MGDITETSADTSVKDLLQHAQEERHADEMAALKNELGRAWASVNSWAVECRSAHALTRMWRRMTRDATLKVIKYRRLSRIWAGVAGSLLGLVVVVVAVAREQVDRYASVAGQDSLGKLPDASPLSEDAPRSVFDSLPASPTHDGGGALRRAPSAPGTSSGLPTLPATPFRVQPLCQCKAGDPLCTCL
jgi:hypothetical protein